MVGVASKLKPSARGELEITDVNNHYVEGDIMRCCRLGRSDAWLDSGTPEALLDAAQYVHAIQERQDRMVGCPEEAAYRQGWVTADTLRSRADMLPNAYGTYLRRVQLDA